MADVTFGHGKGHTPPATMNNPGQWHYVATRLMAHMGAYSPDETNGLHWQWHQRAALCIRALGTHFAHVELHRKIDVCTQLH